MIRRFIFIFATAFLSCTVPCLAAPDSVPSSGLKTPPVVEPKYEAMARLALKDPAGACRVLDEHYAQDLLDEDILFLRGRCYAGLKNYPLAVRNYERLSHIRPDKLNVKIELGKAYAQMGEYKRAKRVYREILDAHPPENLAKRLEEAIAVFDRQQNWYIRTEAGVIFDTNINSGPQNDQIVVFDTPVNLAASAQSQDSFGYTLTADAGYSHRLNKKTALLLQTAFSRNEYIEGSDFDISNFTIGLGPVFQAGKFRTVLQPNFSWLSLGGDTYRTAFGAVNRSSYQLNDRFEAALSATAQATSYPSVTGREGTTFIASPEVTYKPDQKTRATVGAIGRLENAEDAIFSNTAWGGRLGLTRDLGPTLRAAAGYQYLKADYDGEQPAFGNIAREDRQQVATARLDWDISKYTYEKVSISAKYQYIDNASNLAAYRFDRHIGILSISKAW
jgi:tetratricopeptide (TPR) repeat protein